VATTPSGCFLILSPRIFADSFYNIKDLVFLSLFLLSYVCADWYWRSPNIGRSIVFAMVLAVAINSRLIAIVLLPMVLLAGLYQCWVNKKYHLCAGLCKLPFYLSSYVHFIF